jgi:hypothetical protein
MKRAARLSRFLAAALIALSGLAAHAGGPLSVCNGQPLKYPGTGTVTLNYDGAGALGSRTKAQADAIITGAVSLWTNVGTATVTLARGADLPIDVTLANYSSYIGHFTDGLNPVIYDTDGSITDDMLGIGAKSYVLGFAGSAAWGPPTCAYAEGQAVINGALGVSNTTMTIVMAHEIGHLIGLDHTEIDTVQGLSASGNTFPLMYPIAERTSADLHEDDIAAVSELYPDGTFSTTYGHVSGNLTRADGVTKVLGANVWAKEDSTGKLYSVVSDYLGQGTGFFKLALPAGSYTLHASAIDGDFTGGSSVGPYSETGSDASFQAPLYVSGLPMTPVTLGNATPVHFTITPGCSASATFSLNGTGGVTGNCTPTPASMTSPAPGSILSGSSVTFQWSAAGGATLYQVFVGSSVGASDIGYFPAAGTSGTSTTVSGLPTDGRTLHVRLYTAIGGTWYFRDYTYTAANLAPPTPASMTSPAPGSTLSGASAVFQWSPAVGATLYQVFVGTSVGAFDIGYFPAAGTTTTATTISGLPTDGRTLYVRLYTAIGGMWYYRDYTYTAYTATVVTPASMIAPANGATLSGTSQAFQWSSAAGATLYQVFVGNSVGAYDIGYFPAAGTTGTSTTISSLPTDGRTLYVRLYSAIGGTWYYRDYEYTAASLGSPTAAVMTSPTNGTALAGSSVNFQWNAAVGGTLYQVFVGNSVGAYDIGYFPTAGTAGNSTTIAGLPTDGRTLYVRLYTAIAGSWYYNDYVYTAASGTPSPASITSPVNGATLSGSSVTFQWNAAPGATLYQIFVGNSQGAYDIGYFPTAGTTGTSTTITGLPTDGRTLYVRLYTAIAGTYYYRDYTYRSGP